MGRVDIARRIADMWIVSRARAGVSQEWMAMEMGVSKKTIQNWEKGTSAPTLAQTLLWFDAIKINPYPYMLSCIYPEVYNNIDGKEDEDLDAALIKNLDNMSNLEKKQLLYLISGKHGSLWHPLLQMFTAHCHTNLKSRVLTATQIVNSYEMDLKTNHLICNDEILPDLSLLQSAVEAAKESVLNGDDGYFIK